MHVQDSGAGAAAGTKQPPATPGHRERERAGQVARRVAWLARWRVVEPLRHPRKRVVVDGFVVHYHSVREWIAQQLINTGGYERDELAVLCSLAKPGDTVVDVGANIGLHTLHLSRAVGPEGRVIAVEPDAANLRLLRKNIAANHCSNVTVVPYALGDRNGEQTFYVCEGNKGLQGFTDLSGYGKPTTVQVRRADEVLADVSPSLMKIDVEGAEPMVLSAMSSWPDTIFMEYIPSQVRALGNDPREFLDSITARGYDLFEIEDGQLVATTPERTTTMADASGAEHNLVARRR